MQLRRDFFIGVLASLSFLLSNMVQPTTVGAGEPGLERELRAVSKLAGPTEGLWVI